MITWSTSKCLRSQSSLHAMAATKPVRSSRGRRGKRLKILYSLYLAVPHSCHAGLCPAYRTMRITLPLVQPLGVYDIAPSGVSVSSANVPVSTTPSILSSSPPSTRPSTPTSMPHGMKLAPAPLPGTNILGNSPGLCVTSCTASSPWISFPRSSGPNIVIRPAASRVCALDRPNSSLTLDSGRCDSSWRAEVRAIANWTTLAQ